jgi:hypothetical protein
MGLGEFAILLLVAIIVIGPAQLYLLLRRCAFTAGYLAGSARYWARRIEDDPMLFAITMGVLAAASAGLLGHARP